MKPIILILLLLSFLPIEISETPIPITIVTFIAPISIFFLRLPKNKETFLVLLTLVIGLTISLISSLFIQSFHPFFSFLSFFSPISGLLIALAAFKQENRIYKLIQLFWIPGFIMGLALLINLIIYSGTVRGSILVSNSLNGDFFASTALGSFLSLKLFAAFGINSLAGICLSFIIMLCLTFYANKQKTIRLIILLSLIPIIWYGSALGSRAFYIGLFSFIGFIILNFRKNRILKYLFFLSLSLSFFYILAKDPRIILTVQTLLDGDFQSFTSNRSELWKLFVSESNFLIGSAFRPINFVEFGSTSYHLYVFSLIGKAGIITAIPIIVLLLSSISSKPFKLYNKYMDLIIIGGCYSFLIQSLVWDIYAVQLYGHIAWFFVGLKLVGHKKPQKA